MLSAFSNQPERWTSGASGRIPRMRDDSRIEKVGIAVWKNGSLLTVRKRGLKEYILPGGKPDPDDIDDMQTLRRELQEELGCSVDADSLRWVGVFADNAAGESTRQIQVRLYMGHLDGVLHPASEIVEYKWFDPASDDPCVLAPSIRNSILPHFLTHL